MNNDRRGENDDYEESLVDEELPIDLGEKLGEINVSSADLPEDCNLVRLDNIRSHDGEFNMLFLFHVAYCGIRITKTIRINE